MSGPKFDLFGQQTQLSKALMNMEVINKHKTNPVSWMYERLADYIKEFELSLDEAEEVGARLVSFGNEIVFHIEDIGYYGPDMITFHGINDQGKRVQLIQHFSQLSVLLVALPKLGAEARRIGFRMKQEAEDETPS